MFTISTFKTHLKYFYICIQRWILVDNKTAAERHSGWYTVTNYNNTNIVNHTIEIKQGNVHVAYSNFTGVGAPVSGSGTNESDWGTSVHCELMLHACVSMSCHHSVIACHQEMTSGLPLCTVQSFKFTCSINTTWYDHVCAFKKCAAFVLIFPLY